REERAPAIRRGVHPRDLLRVEEERRGLDRAQALRLEGEERPEEETLSEREGLDGRQLLGRARERGEERARRGIVLGLGARLALERPQGVVHEKSSRPRA